MCNILQKSEFKNKNVILLTCRKDSKERMQIADHMYVVCDADARPVNIHTRHARVYSVCKLKARQFAVNNNNLKMFVMK